MELYREVQENAAAGEGADAKAAEIFAFFDEVGVMVVARVPDADLSPYPHPQVYAKWNELPLEDVQAWTSLAAETQSAVDPAP